MNRILSLLLLLTLALASVQCSDNIVETMEPDGPLGRGIAPVDKSETNPTLLTDWENCKTVKLNELGPNGQNLEAALPWQYGVKTSLNSNFCHDIKAADGWYMLFHTFCKDNVDVDLSYMCFYNKFTGYMKIFYYTNVKDAGTSTIWSISSADNQTPQPIFADLEYFSQPLEGDNTYSILSATADNMIPGSKSGLEKGWNGFEFRVGEYHPNISTAKLSIKAYNTLYTDYKIDGVTESATNGTITTTNTVPTSGGKTVGAIANVSGQAAKDVVDSYASKHLNKSFLGFNIANIVTSVATGNYVSAFKSGLGFIFKGLFRKEPTVSEVKLQTNGTVTLQGSAETLLTSEVSPLEFDLEKILSNDRKILVDSLNIHRPGRHDTIFFPINPHYFATTTPNTRMSLKTELGVWNLKEKPVVYYDRYTKFENGFEFSTDEMKGGIFDFNGMTYYPTTHVNTSEIKVVFNPAIKDYVTSYSVNVGLIDVEGGNRNLHNSGKHIIYHDWSNNIKTDRDRNISVYGVDSLYFSFSGSIYDYPLDLFNNDTQFYIDWGENVGGNRAAVVTLTMDIDYNGKKMSFTESRVYDVVYKPYSPWWLEQQVNNPPYSMIINDRNSYNVIGMDLPTGR